MVYGHTAHNRSVYASPPFGGSGYTKTQSGSRPLCVFAPPHFFAPVKMLRIFPYRAQKNVIYNRNIALNNSGGWVHPMLILYPVRN